MRNLILAASPSITTIITLYEFSDLDLEDKYDFIWRKRKDVSLNCFRDDGDYKYVLFDCGTFFAESCVLNGKTIKIEGFDLTDDRINLYIDWLQEHNDDPKYQLF